MSLCCDAVHGGGVQEGKVRLVQLSAGFQSPLPLSTSKLGPSSADSWVSRPVYILGPCGFLQQTLPWGWEFLLLPQPPQVFSVRGFEAPSPHTETLGCAACLASLLLLPVLPTPPATTTWPCPPAAALLCMSLLLPSCPSLLLLLVWMNVSSLIPWLSDFYTVRFSVSSV